jgi:mRNA interferase RelE/StbE
MGSYEIQWKSSATRDLHNIDSQQIPRIIKAVESLANNPFPPQHRKIRGSVRDYRIRIGDYRVVYQVHTKSRAVIIYHVRHRRYAYRR